MDRTLIKTISGSAFPRDANDWELLYPEVPAKLKKYFNDGYKVVIFSNQANLGIGKITLKDFKLKIERLVKKLGIPMQVRAFLNVFNSNIFVVISVKCGNLF
jgi:bifunctional polynucleotide phosphatase/kinase